MLEMFLPISHLGWLAEQSTGPLQPAAGLQQLHELFSPFWWTDFAWPSHMAVEKDPFLHPIHLLQGHVPH